MTKEKVLLMLLKVRAHVLLILVLWVFFAQTVFPNMLSWRAYFIPIACLVLVALSISGLRLLWHNQSRPPAP